MTSIRKSLLWGALSLGLLMAIGAGVAIKAIVDGKNGTYSLYAERLAPLLELQILDQGLREIRFHMSSVALEQTSPVAAKKYIEERMPRLREALLSLQTVGQNEEPAVREKIEFIAKDFQQFETVVKKTLAAYENQGNAKNLAALILEMDWPDVRDGLIKHMDALVPLYRDKAKIVAQQVSEQAASALTTVSIALVILFIGVTYAVWRLYDLLLRRLGEVMKAVGEIASLNLTTRITSVGQDEFAQILKGLEDMRIALLKIVNKTALTARLLEKAASELSGASERSASSGEEQSRMVSSISATIEELTVSIEQIRDNTETAHNLTEQANASAQEANDITNRSLEGIRHLVRNVRESADQVTGLGKASKTINTIASTIRGIAEQTNLLALNAAIEAARAGEAGRGFAVVADEVRKLAEQTAKATANISARLEAIQSGTDNAVSLMQTGVSIADSGETLSGQANAAVHRIHDYANDIYCNMSSIHDALNEQNSSMKELQVRVERIVVATDEVGEANQVTRSKAAEVAHTADDLAQLVAQFRLAA